MENLSAMHWMALKKMVEERGQEWKDKATAIKFLAAAGAGEIVAKPEIKPPEKPAAAPKPEAKTKPNVSHFDRGQPFGYVTGELAGMPGACYTQHGAFFDSEGQKVG